MALVIQTIPMTGSYVPYERPPQDVTLWTAIPRGLQSFLVATEQLDLKPVGDEFLLQLQGTLPPNFGYVLADVNHTIAQASAVEWENEWNLNLQNFYRAPGSLSAALSGNWFQEFPIAAIDDTQRNMKVVQPFPTFPMIGTPGTSGILINMTAWNNGTTATAVGTTSAFISFWQFDLEQVRKFAINAPLPVHSR